jgi:hypothetical protein
MAQRGHPKRTGHVARRRGIAARLGPSASDLVIVSRALADLAEFLERRQESTGRGRVILDRRVEERRRAAHVVQLDRRRTDRRQLSVGSTEALMRVLGFMVIPTDGSPARPRGRTRLETSPRAPRAPTRTRAATRGHRARRRRT